MRKTGRRLGHVRRNVVTMRIAGWLSDELLAMGVDRAIARHRVADQVKGMLARWRK